MRYAIIFRYGGIALLINGAFLFLSAFVSLLNGDSGLFPILYTGFIAVLFGVFPFIFIPASEEITNKEGFTIVVSSWLLSCLIGMLPYLLWGGEFTLVKAWFESVSGFTTTGASILKDIEALPPGLLFWRASTHWIGGVGIIIFVLSVLPSMGKVGMILYRTEISTLAATNFRYRAKKTMQVIMFVYLGLTVLETAALMICGLNLFDAVTHAFSTISTGGFSPKSASIGHYASQPVETVVMIFMTLAGIHFGLLYVTLTGNVMAFLRSTVVRVYLFMLTAGTVLAAVTLHGTDYPSWMDAFRQAAFQVISIGTSTGFATADTNLWPTFAKLLLILFMFQCACSGSTTGGIKVDRTVLLWHALKKRIMKVEHPHAVVKAKIDGMTIDDDVLEATLLFMILFIIIVFLSTLAIGAMGMDLMTAFSASAATLANVGPGFGLVGSASNFSFIPDTGLWVLSFNMLLGRLEIFGLLLFFLLRYWK